MFHSVVENAIYNSKYWLAMRARDLNFINDIFDRIAPELSTDKLDEVGQPHIIALWRIVKN